MMIKLNLKGNYKTVQEGERVLEITDAKVSPSGAPNKLTLQMKDVEDGATLQNSYNFNNNTSVWAMGMMLSVALGLEDGDDFNTNDVNKLVGIKLLCEVAHSEYNDKTYANVKKVISRVDEDGVVETNTSSEDTAYPDVDSVLYNKKGRSAIANNDLD